LLISVQSTGYWSPFGFRSPGASREDFGSQNAMRDFFRAVPHFHRHFDSGLLHACPAKTKSPILSFSRWRTITTGLHENTKDVRLSPDYSQRQKREMQIFHIKSQANDLFFWEIYFFCGDFSLQLTLLSKKRRQSLATS